MLNRVMLIGNLVEDPEIKYTPTGTAVGRIRLAVTRTYNREETDFFNVVTWRKTAENCANYLKKGSQCAIEGRLQTRSYEAKDGQKRWVTEVVADEVHFLGSRKDAQAPASAQAQSPADADWEKLGRVIDQCDDDVPF